ncbi:MAG: ATP-binding cassette domain-containing protein [Halobacteria archaeon]
MTRPATGLEADLQEVTKRFGPVTALDGVSLCVRSREIFCLVGPSGAGKTTLLRVAALLDAPDGGRVGHAPAWNSRRQIAMLHQRPHLFRGTVFDNVAYGLRLRNWPEPEVEREVGACLEAVGLRDRASSRARSLSGGEAQRVAFARAIATQPRLLLLDEFTANLDPANVALLEQAVLRYRAQGGGAVLMASHNFLQAKRMADRVGLLLGGRLVEVAEKTRFFENPEREETRKFLKGEMAY